MSQTIVIQKKQNKKNTRTSIYKQGQASQTHKSATVPPKARSGVSPRPLAAHEELRSGGSASCSHSFNIRQNVVFVVLELTVGVIHEVLAMDPMRSDLEVLASHGRIRHPDGQRVLCKSLAQALVPALRCQQGHTTCTLTVDHAFWHCRVFGFHRPQEKVRRRISLLNSEPDIIVVAITIHPRAPSMLVTLDIRRPGVAASEHKRPFPAQGIVGANATTSLVKGANGVLG